MTTKQLWITGPSTLLDRVAFVASSEANDSIVPYKGIISGVGKQAGGVGYTTFPTDIVTFHFVNTIDARDALKVVSELVLELASENDLEKEVNRIKYFTMDSEGEHIELNDETQ